METKDALVKIEGMFEEFKKQNDEILEKANRGEFVPQEYKNRLDKVQDALDGLTAEMKRAPLAGTVAIGQDGLTPEEAKARKEAKDAQLVYLRKGKGGLGEVEKKALSSRSDTEGGVVVTEEFRLQLIKKLRDIVLIRSYATVLQTSKGSIGFPVFDYDGSVEWTAESEAISEEDISNAFGKEAFTPHKLARIFRLPVELVEDADVNLETLLLDHFATRYAEIEENAFLNGNGRNKPLGLLQVGLGTRQKTGTGVFSADDILDLIYDVRAVYRQRGVFLMHRNAIRAARKLKDKNDQYLWQPSLQAGQPAVLAGYPVLESEFFPDKTAAGNAGDPLALFGDLSHYWIVDRTDLAVQRLAEKYAEFDQIGYKLRKRTDAAPTLKDPFKVLTRA